MQSHEDVGGGNTRQGPADLTAGCEPDQELAAFERSLEAKLERQLGEIRLRLLEARRIATAAAGLSQRGEFAATAGALKDCFDRLSGPARGEHSDRQERAAAPAQVASSIPTSHGAAAGPTPISHGASGRAPWSEERLRWADRDSARTEAGASADDVAPPVAGAGSRPGGVRTTEGPVWGGTVIPSSISRPTWEPRPLEELEEDREATLARAGALDPTDPGSLAEFKAEAAHFQAAWQERKRHQGAQVDWQESWRVILELHTQTWPDHYCVALAHKSMLTPDDWRQVEARYRHLAQASRAMAWVQTVVAEEAPNWLRRDCLPLLEGCAAAAARLYRWLQLNLSDQRDNEQRDLYSSLRSLGSSYGFVLRSLSPGEEASEDDLEAQAGSIGERLESLRVAWRARVAQAERLQSLTALLDEPGFGGAEDDDDRLCAAARACLDAGVPPTDRRLRDPLLELSWMLEDDPALARLHAAVVEESERREREAASLEDEQNQNGDRPLPPELLGRLHAVLRVTQGCRGVIVGGTCREGNRRAIEETLQLADLRWPDTDPSDSFERSAREIGRSEIVFLTRFNRKRSKEAIRLCRDQGSHLVHLPKGYGLNEVIQRAYEQLCPS